LSGERPFAAAASLAAATAIGCLVVATVRTPGFRTADYVSELGVGGGSSVYRAGVLAAALGVAAYAGAVRRIVLAAGLLGASSLLFVGSAAVTCTPGCPLPPYQETTAQDLAHAGASAGALGLAGLAMLVLAARHPDRLVAAVCAIAGLVELGFMAATGIALLANTQGTVNGVLERCVVGAALSWLLVSGALLAVRGPSRAQIAVPAGPAG
jgi:hypothetical protein